MLFRVIYSDGIGRLQFGMQDPATPVSEGIFSFHNDLMLVMIFVVVFVGVILGRIVYNFEEKKNKVASKVVHGTVIEIVWTIIPALILMVIAVPSFTLLYAVDEVVEPSVTVKVIGSQWYWSYEVENMVGGEEGIEFDSYMLDENDLEVGELRLLEVDNRLLLPVETHIRFIVTASDVLHCWAVPSFGIKIDGCPGRLNEVSSYIKRPGTFFGQCSELCGVNHGFMPIGIDVVSKEEFLDWFNDQ